MRSSPLLALLSCTLPACGGGSSDPDGGPGTADAASDAADPVDADPSAVPRVEATDCRFGVDPGLGLAEGTDYECGDLIVYEDRAAATRTLRLHYIRFHGSGSTTAASIYLDGGPGGSGEGIVSYFAYLGHPFLDPLLAIGDFLVIGQRGTALSVPFLDCQEQSCADFAGEYDLPSFNTAANADDVNDLRAALGYQQLNLYGISYGSRLGLEVLRRHGEQVRVAVIDGLVPSQVVWPAGVPASFYSSLTALDASCADDGGCGAAFGDLEADFVAGVQALNDQPVTISYQGTDTQLDGYTYAYLLFQVLYSKSTFPWLPLTINDLAIRRTDRVNDFLGNILNWASGGNGISTGLYYSVVCGELFNPPSQSAFDTANADVPVFIRDLFSGSWYGLLGACDTWPKGDLQAELAAPVTSSVPTLVGSGRLDPITPPTYGAIAATTLDASTSVVYENSGHGATLQSSCAHQHLHSFLTDPATTIDTGCAAAVTTDYVLPGAVTAPVLPVARIRAELARAPLPPHMRRWLERRQ